MSHIKKDNANVKENITATAMNQNFSEILLDGGYLVLVNYSFLHPILEVLITRYNF
jgi:hypothetical protein